MLNMDLIKYRDEMANKKIESWGEWKVVEVLVGELYSLMGDYTVPKIDNIIAKFTRGFRDLDRVTEAICGVYTYSGTLDSLVSDIRPILMRIDDFLALNAARIVDSKEYWIDLDAVFQNMWYHLSVEQIFNILCESTFDPSTLKQEETNDES